MTNPSLTRAQRAAWQHQRRHEDTISGALQTAIVRAWHAAAETLPEPVTCDLPAAETLTTTGIIARYGVSRSVISNATYRGRLIPVAPGDAHRESVYSVAAVERYLDEVARGVYHAQACKARRVARYSAPALGDAPPTISGPDAARRWGVPTHVIRNAVCNGHLVPLVRGHGRGHPSIFETAAVDNFFSREAA